jgi:hypothetical protein
MMVFSILSPHHRHPLFFVSSTTSATTSSPLSAVSSPMIADQDLPLLRGGNRAGTILKLMRKKKKIRNLGIERLRHGHGYLGT